MSLLCLPFDRNVLVAATQTSLSKGKSSGATQFGLFRVDNPASRLALEPAISREELNYKVVDVRRQAGGTLISVTDVVTAVASRYLRPWMILRLPAIAQVADR